MTTEVVLTGTGVPHPGTPPHTLTAVFLTHVHSDHVVGLPDVAMTRWIQQQVARSGPLVVDRVETPDGVVVVSGDTRVCNEVEDLARDADVLVHEACRASALAPLIAGSVYETIFSYHADTVALGGLAARAGVPHVVLTHLIPPLDAPGDADTFVDDLRAGGYGGRVTVGEDLTTIPLEGARPCLSVCSLADDRPPDPAMRTGHRTGHMREDSSRTGEDPPWPRS